MIRLFLARFWFPPKPGCVYPHGSMRWNNDDHDPSVRAKRWACSSVNHHPRERFDGWCMGFGYGCTKCGMWADPWPQAKLEAVVDDANRRERNGEQFYLGDLCGLIRAVDAVDPHAGITTDRPRAPESLSAPTISREREP